MGICQEAIEKVESDPFEHGSPQEVLQRILLAWLSYDEHAPEYILMDDKSVEECYEHIEQCARQLHQASVNAAPEQEIKWMLDYYGVAGEEADALIEDGMMYHVFTSLAAQFRPHGAEEPRPAAEEMPAQKPEVKPEEKDAVASLDLDKLLG